MAESSADNKQDTATAAQAGNHQQIDQAVAQGGAYEVLRKRLSEQGARLRGVADTLNTRRLQEFGDSRMEILGRLRIRTENNCVGRDIVQVGDQLLFGFNVFIGLKTQTRIEDVFGLYKLVETPDGYDVSPVELAGSFLGQQAFVHDFNELYAYYKDARLLQLIVIDSKLLASFQIGERRTDVRVFRWAIGSDGAITYIDARGERDIALPPPFDFEWTRATREIAVNGRFPHLNIYDTLFVETTGGDLTIKVENNTESGAGIYSEPVDDKTQSLDDAVFDYARVGSLILLKILPYRETEWRGLVYNTLTGKVTRVDAIVQACVQLPEDHGIIFPGGYYLQNGEHKAFDAAMDGMQFKRAIRSPNGEDVLYVFYERASGLAALFVYNLIQRKLQNPLFAHGYARLVDGRMVLFHAENNDPTRIHQMQVWQTPFTSDEFAATRPPGTSFLGRIGNAELVRAISNLYDLSRTIDRQEVSVQRYQSLTHDTRRLFDAHHWFDNDNCEGLDALLHEITATGESVLDEYEKVESIRRQSDTAMSSARGDHRTLMSRLLPENWNTIQEFVDALNAITRQRGHLLTIREYRYIDTAAIDAMTAELQQAHDAIGSATGTFLGSDKALQPFQQRLQELDSQAAAASTARQLAEHLDGMRAMSADLDMLSELMASLKVDDATQRTRVVESISQIYARLNQARARAEQQRKSLGSAETVAQFGAQFTLFGQAITSALGLATTPERADEQLSRLMVQLEELESQFGEHEQFLGDILGKREELLEAFESHKQALLDDRQRKAASVMDAANRILDGLGRRTERFATPDELNAFFAGDPLILKLRELAERLRGYRDAMKADDVDARIKAARDQAVRALRDRSELLEDGGNVIRLGPRHRFSVNTQPLDLTILPRGDGLAIHLTGTEYMEPVRSEALDHLRDYWQATLDSESAEVYRGEYLAGQILSAALAGSDGLSLDLLERQLPDLEALSRTVAQFAAPRYRDGYEKGIHDHDATLILRALLPLRQQAGPLIHTPDTRALALAWWSQQSDATTQHWIDRLTSAHAIRRLFASDLGLDHARQELTQALAAFAQAHPLDLAHPDPRGASTYLADEIVSGRPDFSISRYAPELVAALDRSLQDGGLAATFQAAMSRLQDQLSARWSLARQWLQAMCAQPAHAGLAGFVHEAVALMLLGRQLPHQVRQIELMTTVQGLLGEHPRIAGGTLALSIDETLSRLRRHDEHYVPGFRRYQGERHELIVREREALRLSEFKARPLTSFVRNRLINDLYLPVIGDNLAKQMGTVGDDKRSDLMGLLMMISPPGYGKTTLMEYVAHRLGLIFMKINGPALGHEVRSVDPAQAPDATSRQELEKLNLALEMGNNVMLYVDDIQHTHPEFLQKFISLCDGTRRIEGVWKGRTKTYDMRGRRFAVVMAGNPYTESGEVFKIPDMLANRADIYNLGDVLGGMEEVFTLSYIENCLTSNPVLAPLATRDLKDLYLLVDKANGKEVSGNALSHTYSGAEINEIVATLQRLMKVRDIVYKVNQQYIVSAAQDDRYRVEPPFRLQGSYRNMNKLAEKISPVMNDAELQQLISDHYLGEAQLLTTGAEENLLKLAELRGVLDDGQRKRWTQIKADFLRNKAMGGDEADVGGRVVAQLADIAGGLQSIGDHSQSRDSAPAAPWPQLLDALQQIAKTGKDTGSAAPALPAPIAAPIALPVADVSTVTSPAQSPLLEVAIRPLLDSLQAQHGEQRTLAIALGQLAEAIREGALLHPGATDAGAGATDKRKRRKLTPEEIEFNRELERLRFSGKPAPGD